MPFLVTSIFLIILAWFQCKESVQLIPFSNIIDDASPRRLIQITCRQWHKNPARRLDSLIAHISVVLSNLPHQEIVNWPDDQARKAMLILMVFPLYRLSCLHDLTWKSCLALCLLEASVAGLKASCNCPLFTDDLYKQLYQTSVRH